MDLYNDDVRDRLFRGISQSALKLEPFRLLREGLVADYAGSSYGYGSNTVPVFETYMNLMQQAVDAYVMNLAANRPRVTIDTSHPENRFFARHFSVAVNGLLQEIKLEETLRKWVTDAFFCMGVVKVHMADTGAVELWDGGGWVDPGSPFASSVSLDDFVYDTSAIRWDQIHYAADSYRIPYDVLKDSNQFDQDETKDLQPTIKQNFIGWGQRTEMLSKGYQSEADDVVPMIDMMDVWDPGEQKIWTFALDTSDRFRGKGRPVAVMNWTAPELGPYHLLSFCDVPDNIMPASPAAQLASLCKLINNLIRKQSRQAKRQKDIMVYSPAGAESAKKISQSSDGDMVQVEDPKEIGQLKFGGVDTGNQVFLQKMIEILDRAAGNLPAMLGLGQQADTLGQEQLIAGSVSKKDAQMRMRCMDATRGLVRNLAYMLWHDCAKVLPGRMDVPNVPGATIDSTWKPEYRMGEFHDYDLDIDVYSMQYQPPQAKASAINNLVQTVYLPLAQMMQGQGGQINVQALVDLHAELLDLPRLKEVVQFATPSAGEGPGGGEAPPMPQSTTRKYVRQDSPGQGVMGAGKADTALAGLMAKAGQTNPDMAMSMAG